MVVVLMTVVVLLMIMMSDGDVGDPSCAGSFSGRASLPKDLVRPRPLVFAALQHHAAASATVA